jgi:hypothetical protein
MPNYALMHRLGLRPWERYALAAADSISVVLDREEAERVRPLGRALDLAVAGLGRFDFFLDIGCFQGLDAAGRRAQGDGVTALANLGATLLMLCFGRTRARSMVGGVSRDDVEKAFVRWETITVEPADTVGLGWPMNRTKPQWYRLRLRATDEQ